MSKPTRAARGGLHRGSVRAVASLLGAALIFASIVPPFALAEAESEGEGGAPPGGIPGLEITVGGESQGEETPLEEVPAGPGEEAEEEAPVSEGGTPEAPPPAPVAVPEEAPPSTSVEPVVAPQPEATSTPAAPPSYAPEESSPSYETAPEPGGEAVRNEAITAPATSAPEQHPARPASSGPVAAAPEASIAAPEPAPVEPEPLPSPTPVAPAASSPVERGGLAGKKSHTVAAGECLWTIAEGYLPPGASNAEIAAEVHRLWVLNARRIGTGDPDVLLIGTVLRLR